MKEYLKKKLKLLARWLWLRLLYHVAPKYWPAYLRQDLRPTLRSYVQTLAARVTQFDQDHWRELSARATREAYWSSSVGDTGTLIASTFYEITAWRNCYKVHVTDSSFEPSPTPLDGRACIDYKVLLPIIEAVYVAVKKARDDHARAARDAAEERRLEAQRQDWAKVEVGKGKAEKDLATITCANFLKEMKAYDLRYKTAMSDIHSCSATINALNKEAIRFNDEVTALATKAIPFMEAVKRADQNLDGVLSLVLHGAPDDEDTSSSSQASPLHAYQLSYTDHYGQLSKIKADMDERREKRKQCRRQCVQKLKEIEELKKTIQMESQNLIKSLKSLRALIDAIKDDSKPQREWQRLEAQARQNGNNFTKTTALMRSLHCWHLENFKESADKQQFVNTAQTAGDGFRTDQNKAFTFQKTFTVAAPSIDYSL